MGIDPGLTRCGVGVVARGAQQHLSAVAFDVVRTPVEASLGERLVQLAQYFAAAMAQIKPDVVVVEQVFMQQNVASAMYTAQAAGVAHLVATQQGIPVASYTPTQVKAAVCGSGRADKAQVNTMVQRLLRTSTEGFPPDTADALAIAICHCWQAPTKIGVA